MTFRALVADDHSLYRTGLALLLKDRLSVTDVIEVNAFDPALDRLADTPGVALALFDLSMPGMGGPASLTVIKETYPGLRIAVVSAREDRETVLQAISVGVNGYVPKSLSEDEMTTALQRVMTGDVFIPNFMAISQGMLPPGTATEAGGVAVPTLSKLTPRQRDVLGCILRGRSNKEIARDIGIAEGTVKIHLAALFAHFSARNRTELATRAQSLSG